MYVCILRYVRYKSYMDMMMNITVIMDTDSDIIIVNNLTVTLSTKY